MFGEVGKMLKARRACFADILFGVIFPGIIARFPSDREYF